MPDVVETVWDGEEKAREDRGEKEVVKDDEGRGISVSAVPPAHKQRRVGRRAPAASSSTDRGIPSRDARINRFPVRPYKRPEEGGTGGRRKRRACRRRKGRGARARRDHSTRIVGTKERQKEKRERERDSEAGSKDRIYQDWKPRVSKKMGIEGGGLLAVEWRYSRLAVRCPVPSKKILRALLSRTRIFVRRESDCYWHTLPPRCLSCPLTAVSCALTRAFLLPWYIK